MEPVFKYDVAISFLARDENLATELHERLAPQFSVFTYPRRQEEVVGTDGYTRFSEIFSREAGVVLILHREQWGRTAFTSVEEEAIKYRHFSGTHSWEFLLLAKLDESAPPQWIPPYRIYHQMPGGSVETLVAVIANKAVEKGAAPQPLSAVGLAAQIAGERARAEADSRYLASREGLEAVRAAVVQIYDDISGVVKAVQKTGYGALHLSRRATNAQLSSESVTFTMWFSERGVQPSERSFGITRFSGLHPQNIDGRVVRDVPAPRQLGIDHFFPRRSRTATLEWEEKASGRLYSTSQLADLIVQRLLSVSSDGR
jgi:hypothetical protein